MYLPAPWLRRSMLSATVALLAVAAISSAQCPDGAPPPCKGPVPAALRRINPPLDTRAWIVVPFGNVTKTPELDWLRDASVNLLSLDIGRWTDIRVVPDKRVGDLLRELPLARTAATLTLSDGLSIARRAGAGNLVMGDFFKVGKGARLVANVFDVATGAKLRSAVQQASEQDSLLTAFTPLAHGVLAVPPPADARMGELGTTKLDAYQEYLTGVRAFNADQIPEARVHLERAIALDSTFALAHFQLSGVLGWIAEAVGGVSLQHARAAVRLGTSLPRRERALIEAQAANSSGDYGKACNVLAPIVARDSLDVQALHALAECAYHDHEVEVSPTDTLAAKFRSSWNVSLRSFQRVLELDPSYYVAFEHVFDILRTNFRTGCVRSVGAADCRQWRGVVFRGGDSLETIPATYQGKAWDAQAARAVIERPQIINLRTSKEMAMHWLQDDTTSERAHAALAQTLLAQGDLPAAYVEFARTPMRATRENSMIVRDRFEVLVKLGRGAEARTMFDSLRKAGPFFPGTPLYFGFLDLMFGRFARYDAAIADRAAPLGPEAVAYFRRIGRAFSGVPSPDLDRLTWARQAAIRDSTCDHDCRLGYLAGSHAYLVGLITPTWSPTLGPPFPDARTRLAYTIASGDAIAIRNEALSIDRKARENVRMGWPEAGWSVMAANAYLAIRDTAAALDAARFFVDSAMAVLPIGRPVFCLDSNMCVTPGVLWPRMMLLRADLAAAKGNSAEAKIWYDKLLDLWSTADAEFQPVAERVRKARAALGM